MVESADRQPILPGAFFVIPTPLALRLIQIPPQFHLAIYEIREGKLIAVDRSRKTVIAAAQRRPYPLMGCFLRSLMDLHRELPMPNTPLEALARRRFFGHVGQQLRSMDELLRRARIELGPEIAEELLRTTVNELRATGKPPGRKPTPQQDRRCIDLLRKISRKCSKTPPPLKSLAPAGREPSLWTKTANTQLRRFCLRVYGIWRDVGCPDLRVIWFRTRLAAECNFEFSADECAAVEALERGAEYSHERRSQNLAEVSSSGRQNPAGDLS